MPGNRTSADSVVSVIIPARNEAPGIQMTVRAVLAQRASMSEIELIVVDDGSTDDTPQLARDAGARVIQSAAKGARGNPGVARNLGASVATGDPLIFLDADCVVENGWLDSILRAHGNGAAMVGGALELPAGLPFIARCDYYCGWYVIHPKRKAGYVPHHPPPNLSVRKGLFRETRGFSEQPPLAYSNEERAWQAELQRKGHRIYFEPRAVAMHHNRPGLGNLLRRSYRWGYTAIESKSQTGATRMAWIYRSPYLLVVGSPLYAIAQSVYILACWLRAGCVEPLLMSPLILISRIAYAGGMTVGGIRWVRHRAGKASVERLAPPW